MEALKNKIDKFTYSNISQTYEDYDSEKAYSLIEDTEAQTSDSVCKLGNYYYRSVINDNQGNNPKTHLEQEWIGFRYSNQSAMLDSSSLSKSVVEGDDLIVEFRKGTITNLAIGYFEASSVIIEHLDEAGSVIDGFTKETYYSVNENVIDQWSYMYEPYSAEVDRGLYIPIPPIGITIRVTFKMVTATNRASCGFFSGGEAIIFGDTLSDVNFSFNSFATKELNAFGGLDIVNRDVQELVDFETLIPTNQVVQLKREVKKIYNEIIVFILDPTEDSEYEHLMGLGVIQDATVAGRFSSTKSMMSFSIMESI